MAVEHEHEHTFCRKCSSFYIEWYSMTDPEARVRFPALPKKSSGSGTGSTQPREYN
jgi:hypothetical protein